MWDKHIDLTDDDIKIGTEINEMVKKIGSFENAFHALTTSMMLLFATHPDARNHPEYREQAEMCRNMVLDIIEESSSTGNC